MGNEVAEKPKEQTILGLISSDQFKKQIQAALPAHLTADRMVRVMLTVLRKNPRLMECSRDSLLSCLVTSAQLGLSVDPLLGESYLIPYKNECTIIPGYKGLRKLAMNTGEVKMIQAEIVYKNDKHLLELGTVMDLKHTPNMLEDRGEPIFVYAVAKLENGFDQFITMSIKEINKIRDKSEGYKYAIRSNKDHPWISDWEEMAKKTAIRRFSKSLVLSTDKAEKFYEAIEADQQFDIELPTEKPADPLDSITVNPETSKPQGEVKVKVWNATHKEIPQEVIEAVEKLAASEGIPTTREKIVAFLESKFKGQMGYQIPSKTEFDRIYSVILKGIL